MKNSDRHQPSNPIIAFPPLKWAGGKRQLIEQIEQFLPPELKQGKIKQYIEPMVGGGAVFLWLAQTYELELVVGDLNPELIITYSTIKYDVENLIDLLSDIQAQYLVLSPEERKEYFYKIRTQFNQTDSACFLLKKDTIITLNQYSQQWLNRTAQLIFLNRTCFNGLYRVNSRGYFNVPPGRYKKPTICHSENLRAVAQILAKTEIYWGDFSQCKQWVDAQTFVYFDPPYKPISKTANFTNYSKDSFNDTEQLRLRDFYRSLDRLGAKLLLSNSDPHNTDSTDNFFQTAYADYSIKKVQAKRHINSKAQNRGQINEILIANYPIPHPVGV